MSVTVSHAGAGPVGGAPSAPVIPEFQIVSRLGLILVGVVAVALIAVIANDSVFGLDLMHVGFGGAWITIDLFSGLFLGPIIAKLPLQSRLEFMTRYMPRMLLLMPTVVTATLAAGWQLAVKDGTVLSSYPHHTWVVASFVIVAAIGVVSLGLLSPANVGVLVELKKPKPNPAVAAKLMKRFLYSARVIGFMQLALLVIMTKITVS